MLKDKPVISNQHGALVMAFVPFLYAGFKSGFSPLHFWFAFSWLFLYLFSYPFLSLFSKNRPHVIKNGQSFILSSVLVSHCR
ncbi:Uncharacterised protein [Actinobacillus pleuropneumoniae]|nr:Uncharacterised protein [Actinobacillus pleuropneumoniae]